MNDTSNNGNSNTPKRWAQGLNVNSYISIGLMLTVVSSALWVQASISSSKDEILRQSDERYASREALEAKWGTINELVNARVQVLTDRLSAVSSALNDLRVTVAGIPDLSAGVKDIQRQLDRIEKDRK
jgi:hypothetical protein